MKLLLLLCFICLGLNIYQYRRYSALMEKFQQLKVASVPKKKYQIKKAKRSRPQRREQKEPQVAAPPSQNTMPSPMRRRPLPVVPPGQMDMTEDEMSLKMEEERREWSEDIQNYFTEELALTEEDFQFYQRGLEMLRNSRAEAYDYFSRRGQEEGLPHIPSFEEQRALHRIQEDAYNYITRRIGEENFQKLRNREGEKKMRQLRENGYYHSFGF